MTYYFSSEDLKDISENLEEINKKIILKLKNNSNYFIILITKYLLLFSDFVINQYEVRRKIFISNYLNEIIYQIDYIDIKNNKITNVYYTNFILAFFSILLTNSMSPYLINNRTILNISKIVNSNNNGYLNITYYNESEKKNSLINITNFKRENNNNLLKSVGLLITNIIINFILNKTIIEDKSLMYVEIILEDKRINITNIFRKYKNSFKEENIKLFDFLIMLKYLTNVKYLEIENVSNIELLITDLNLYKTKYNINDNINFKTLYQELSEKN